MTPNILIPAGNYMVSIGNKSTEIAIMSRHSGEWVTFKNLRRSPKLRQIKRKFNQYLCSNNSFFFSHMQKETVQSLIKMLKK